VALYDFSAVDDNTREGEIWREVAYFWLSHARTLQRETENFREVV